jgi:hypothetical protein
MKDTAFDVIGNTKFIGRLHAQLSATGYNKYLLAIKLGELGPHKGYFTTTNRKI